MDEQQIPLGRFIESVKSELLSYQAAHKGEPGLFEINEIEITASVATKIDVGGKVEIFAVSLKAGGKEEGAHQVRIKMSIPGQPTFVGPFSQILYNDPRVPSGVIPSIPPESETAVG